MIDPDKINNADAKRVATASVSVLDRLQNFQSHEQVMASAVVFLTLCEHLKVKAQDVFTTTKNLMNEKHRLRHEFAAVRDYVKYEIKR
jgi:hypothetical protein